MGAVTEFTPMNSLLLVGLHEQKTTYVQLILDKHED